MKLWSCQKYFQGFLKNLQKVKLSNKAVNVDTQENIRCRLFGEIITELVSQWVFNKNESALFGDKSQVEFISKKAKLGLVLTL